MESTRSPLRQRSATDIAASLGRLRAKMIRQNFIRSGIDKQFNKFFVYNKYDIIAGRSLMLIRFPSCVFRAIIIVQKGNSLFCF